MYHPSLAAKLDAAEIAGVFWYGLRMDASFTGYICILPFLLWLIKSCYPAFRVKIIIRVYTIILIFLFSFLTVADLELYTAWGYRMDATPLEYFSSPEEMAGSVSSSPVWILLLIFLVLSFLFVFLYRFADPFMGRKIKRVSVGNIIISLVLLAILFIPIRGGIQKIPMNLSDVYFSEKLFADHAAINLPWNISFSLLNRNNPENPFQYFPPEKAQHLVDKLYQTDSIPSPQILSVPKPNVIFIILESFTAKLVGSMGGTPGVTPQLDSIAANGLLFTNIYAAGDRSEKGQSAILSGYPNQAIHSIVKTPTKTMELPSLCQALSQAGYYCNYTYGGELEFANIKSYLINTGYEDIVGMYDFPADMRTTSWGVHDEHVFDQFFHHLEKMPQPFFATIFSLSSHEPYDVPVHHIKGEEQLALFQNSMYYTDSVLGDFIQRIKKEPWWDNTLVVIVADHGHPLPGHDPNGRPSKFHIPLVFTGGALQMKGRNNTIGSQTDIAATVLNQLNLPADQFHWSKDLLDSTARQFAFYSFNNGFGWVVPSGIATVDNVSGKTIFMIPGFDTTQLKFGKAYMQASYQDFLER